MATLTVDTCFLIDHQREVECRRAGPAQAFFRAHPDDCFAVSSVAWGEYLAGFDSAEDEFVVAVRQRLSVLAVDEAVAAAYSRVFRALKGRGELIGANDMWIAACAVAHDLALVSRNGSEFRRVPGLRVLVY